MKKIIQKKYSLKKMKTDMKQFYKKQKNLKLRKIKN